MITDMTRYVAGALGREFVSVPTAASMDGYASGVAVVEFGGMKKSYPADPPVAIFAEPRTIAAAPAEMTRAGIGDLLGKATASTDWLASHALYGEERCLEVARLVTDSFVRVANEVEDILGRLTSRTARLLQGLIESGTAIAMVGSSRPASGSEHEVSHFWDLLAADGRRPHSSHGLQVGYATHFAMRLQQYCLRGRRPRAVFARAASLPATSLWTFSATTSAQVEEMMEEKQRFLAENASHWPATDSQWQAACDADPRRARQSSRSSPGHCPPPASQLCPDSWARRRPCSRQACAGRTGSVRATPSSISLRAKAGSMTRSTPYSLSEPLARARQ